MSLLDATSHLARAYAVLALLVVIPSIALAQRVPFERSFESSASTALDVRTMRGALDVSAGSSSVELHFDRAARLALDATSGSGDVHVVGVHLDDASISKGSATGTLGTGGPLVRASTRSGSVTVGLGLGL
jgi:hypothetical protein